MNDDGMRLAGRRILITGAASGIGRSTAELFARHGAALALLDHQREPVEVLATALSAVPLACDVSDEDAVTAAVAAAQNALGGLDGLVNAAGISRRGLVEDVSTQVWRRTIDVNLFGPYFVCRAAIPALRETGRGTIVNIASIGALRPAKGVAAYCASKAGVLMLSKCLAAELAPDIRVNAVCPGTVETPMTEELLQDAATAQRLTTGNALDRLGVPEDIADALLYLTDHRSAYTNGATLVVDGGYVWH